MRCSSRYLTKELKLEHIKCSVKEDEYSCDDCGKALPGNLASQIIGGRLFCKDCALWYKQQEELDKLAIEEDLKRTFERDYWD